MSSRRLRRAVPGDAEQEDRACRATARGQTHAVDRTNFDASRMDEGQTPEGLTL
jgi:hypothetical protein